MIVGWVLAITLVLVQHPLYSHYALLAHRPGGISALTDQQFAAGVMWVPGSISYTITMMLGVYRWLEPDTKPHPRRTALTDLRRTDSAMPPFFFADNFLAGSLLIAAAADRSARSPSRSGTCARSGTYPRTRPTASAALPSSDVLAAADPEAEDVLAIPPADDA